MLEKSSRLKAPRAEAHILAPMAEGVSQPDSRTQASPSSQEMNRGSPRRGSTLSGGYPSSHSVKSTKPNNENTKICLGRQKKSNSGNMIDVNERGLYHIIVI